MTSATCSSTSAISAPSSVGRATSLLDFDGWLAKYATQIPIS